MPPARTILVVDDDQDFVESVSTYLEAHGYQVCKARDGREGVRLARQRPPDLALVDIMMHERAEGLRTIQNLRRVAGLGTVPVIVTSALDAEEAKAAVTPVDTQTPAYDAFVPKPVELPALLASIHARIGGAPAVPDGPRSDAP